MMTMATVANSEPPIYSSRRTAAGLWQSYAVYRDRLELRTAVGIFKIPLGDIISIERRPPGIKSFATQPNSLIAIKLDVSDFYDHVLLNRKSGLFKWIRFIPDDIDNFISETKSAMARYRR
jgi:hypothetical protein